MAFWQLGLLGYNLNPIWKLLLTNFNPSKTYVRCQKLAWWPFLPCTSQDRSHQDRSSYDRSSHDRSSQDRSSQDNLSQDRSRQEIWLDPNFLDLTFLNQSFFGPKNSRTQMFLDPKYLWIKHFLTKYLLWRKIWILNFNPKWFSDATQTYMHLRMEFDSGVGPTYMWYFSL